MGHRAFHRSPPGILTGDVYGDEDGLPAPFRNLGFHFSPILFPHVPNNNFGSFPSEELGLHRAHTVSATGDNSYFAFQPHDASSLRDSRSFYNSGVGPFPHLFRCRTQ